MDDLVNTVNLLQDVFSASDYSAIDLPQIVVVGSQSSGKSSVLEHLVGKSFLPRGTGIVTRCPLVLQLLPAQGEAAKDKEYAIFQHDKSKVFTDCQLIRQEIELQTSRLAGLNKGICQTPINLKLFSPSFLNLTLVDLPGLTKVPVGDQPHDIEKQTRRLTLKYITKPNCLILAVIPANADMATSESLKIAKEVDSEGSRTLAVVTKLDLMDQGTDATNILTGKVIPVKLGIVGVVNRSQKNIQDNKSIAQSLKDEATFFYTHYQSISKYHGCPCLAKKVQSLLVSHIKNCMPKLRDIVNEKLASKKAELRHIGDSNLSKSSLLLALITTFSNTLVSYIRGNFSNIQTKELEGGARINYVFQSVLSHALKSIDPLVNLTQAEILTAMTNASGICNNFFISQVAFDILVKRQIERLRSPCLKCVDLVYLELRKMAQNCIEDTNLGLKSFPKLQRELSEITTNFLENRLPITRQSVESFIDVQLAYINTSHPDLCPDGKQGMNSGDRYGPSDRQTLVARKTPVSVMSQPSKPDRGSVQKEIQELILKYFNIVRKTVLDTVPKIIVHSLVNFLVENLNLELVEHLYTSPEDAEDLMQESQIIVDMRVELKSDIAQLEKASSIINSVSSLKL